MLTGAACSGEEWLKANEGMPAKELGILIIACSDGKMPSERGVGPFAHTY